MSNNWMQRTNLSKQNILLVAICVCVLESLREMTKKLKKVSTECWNCFVPMKMISWGREFWIFKAETWLLTRLVVKFWTAHLPNFVIGWEIVISGYLCLLAKQIFLQYRLSSLQLVIDVLILIHSTFSSWRERVCQNSTILFKLLVYFLFH